MPDGRLALSEAVKRTVRQRCRFGCIVCGCPLYDYDHVVPHAETQDNSADNLVLLCAGHHREKTNGLLPVQALRRFIDKPHNLANRLTGTSGISFSGPELILDIGSNMVYVNLNVARPEVWAVHIGQIPVLGLRFSDGFPLLQARIFDRYNNPVLTIRDGAMRHTTGKWDVTYVGTTLTLREASRDISLRIRFEPADNRIAIDRGHIYADGIGMEITATQVVILNSGTVLQNNSIYYGGITVGPDVGVNGAIRDLHNPAAYRRARFNYNYKPISTILYGGHPLMG